MSMNTLSKTFSFPKVAYYSSKRVNRPEVELTLRYNDENKPCLSICGSIWNSKHTDCVVCGQCLDDMMGIDELRNDELFRTLYNLWKNWHLNDLTAGTTKQEQALNEARKSGKQLNCYDDACKYLESIGLLSDDGYVYGTKWLYREIPEDAMSTIESLLAA